jgi:hypothetical protein
MINTPLSRLAVIADRLGADTSVVSESTTAGPRQSLAMKLLEGGVPLSLLVDLTSREGPDSAQIIASEGLGD